jgi:hypothetical protein
VELKQTREELEKQKVKLQELELNQKKKIQSEIDKFKKELLDEILGNIKTYIQVLAKENESGQVTSFFLFVSNDFFLSLSLSLVDEQTTERVLSS